MESGYGKCKFLFPAQRKVAHHGIALSFHIYAAENSVGLFGYFLILHTVNASVQAQVLPYFQVLVQGEFLTHIADIALYLFGFPVYIETCHCSFAFRRTAQSAKHSHSCGLPGSVGTKKTEDFSFPYVECNMIDCRKIAKHLGKVLGLYNVFFFHCPSSFNINIKQSSTVGSISLISIFPYPLLIRYSLSIATVMFSSIVT